MDNIFDIILPNAVNDNTIVIDTTDGKEVRHTEI